MVFERVGGDASTNNQGIFKDEHNSLIISKNQIDALASLDPVDMKSAYNLRLSIKALSDIDLKSPSETLSNKLKAAFDRGSLKNPSHLLIKSRDNGQLEIASMRKKKIKDNIIHPTSTETVTLNGKKFIARDLLSYNKQEQRDNVYMDPEDNLTVDQDYSFAKAYSVPAFDLPKHNVEADHLTWLQQSDYGERVQQKIETLMDEVPHFKQLSTKEKEMAAQYALSFQDKVILPPFGIYVEDPNTRSNPSNLLFPSDMGVIQLFKNQRDMGNERSDSYNEERALIARHVNNSESTDHFHSVNKAGHEGLLEILSTGYLRARFSGDFGPENSDNFAARDTLAGPHGFPYIAFSSETELQPDLNRVESFKAIIVPNNEYKQSLDIDLFHLSELGIIPKESYIKLSTTIKTPEEYINMESG